MQVSVVVAAYNEEKHIRACLASLLKQSRPADEIILVDDGSTDRTVAYAEKFKQVRIIRAKHLERARARNLGWQKAHGQIIAFAEADAVFDRHWLAEILKAFQAGADAVIDRRMMYYQENLLQKTLAAVGGLSV